MGRLAGKDSKLMMSASKFIMSAREVAIHLLGECRSLHEFEAFMFGSSLFGIGSDFDILIVGPSGDRLNRLKAELRDAGKELPLDVLYMLPEEARITGFVEGERCVSLLQLAASDGCLLSQQ
jgi:hypothetical protein